LFNSEVADGVPTRHFELAPGR